MAEFEMRLETRESTRAKAAAALGLDQPSVFDTINRGKFATDEQYIDACVEEAQKRSDPTYQAARRKVARELRERQEQEQLARREAEYKRIRSGVQLDSVDQREIDAKAAELAKRDLGAGRISASGLGSKIAEYAEQLTEEYKDTRANNQLFNDMLRGKI